MASHYLSNKQRTKLHNGVVDTLRGLFAGHHVIFPDQEDRRNKRPDVLIDNALAIEVKVLNPSNEDWNEDVSACLQYQKNRRVHFGGRLIPQPIESDIKHAVKKFEGVECQYRLIVFYSPLVWMMRNHKFKDLLTGNIRFEYDRTKDNFKRISNGNVALKAEFTQKLDGVMLLNENPWDEKIILKLNNKDNALLNKVTEKREIFTFNQDNVFTFL